MPIHRERYRRRENGIDVRGRAWIVIAVNGLRALVRRRSFLFLMILAWIPTIVRAVQIYAAANMPSVAQVDFLAINARTFRDFLNQQEPFVFFITVYAGSGLIADDLRARALQLYLSRPVTRAQYIAGKAAILMAALLILALSSTSRSRWFVAVMYAGAALFTHALFGVIRAAVDGTMFSWVSIF